MINKKVQYEGINKVVTGIVTAKKKDEKDSWYVKSGKGCVPVHIDSLEVIG